MKVSLRQKVLTYTVLNFSTVFFSAVAAIQGQMSVQWALVIYLLSTLWMNLLVLYVFRMNDKRCGAPHA